MPHKTQEVYRLVTKNTPKKINKVAVIFMLFKLSLPTRSAYNVAITG